MLLLGGYLAFYYFLAPVSYIAPPRQGFAAASSSAVHVEWLWIVLDTQQSSPLLSLEGQWRFSGISSSHAPAYILFVLPFRVEGEIMQSRYTSPNAKYWKIVPDSNGVAATAVYVEVSNDSLTMLSSLFYGEFKLSKTFENSRQGIYTISIPMEHYVGGGDFPEVSTLQQELGVAFASLPADDWELWITLPTFPENVEAFPDPTNRNPYPSPDNRTLNSVHWVLTEKKSITLSYVDEEESSVYSASIIVGAIALGVAASGFLELLRDDSKRTKYLGLTDTRDEHSLESRYIILVGGTLVLVMLVGAYVFSSGSAQTILAVAATISAVCAAIVAFLNYRSRPLLTKAIEQHTFDHRALAASFASSVATAGPWLADEDQDLLRFINGSWEPTHLLEEDEVLFSDIEKHDSTGILHKWSAWKSRERDYVSTRASVFKTIAEKLSAQLPSYELCLTDVSLADKPKQLRGNAVTLVYGNLVSRYFAQKARDYATLLTGGGVQSLQDRAHYFCRPSFTLLLTDIRNSGTLETDGKLIVDIARNIETLKWIQEENVKEIVKIREELNERKSELLRLLKDFQRIPLLPGRCRFIDASAKL